MCICIICICICICICMYIYICICICTCTCITQRYKYINAYYIHPCLLLIGGIPTIPASFFASAQAKMNSSIKPPKGMRGAQGEWYPLPVPWHGGMLRPNPWWSMLIMFILWERIYIFT